MSGVFLDEQEGYFEDTIGNPYRAHFYTGQMVPAQGDKVANVGYLTVFANPDIFSIDDYIPSCLVQGQWDWMGYSATNSGKWTTPQEVYTNFRIYRAVSRKRLLLRGSGPALQLYFTDQPRQPFEILGWTIQESADAVA